MSILKRHSELLPSNYESMLLNNYKIVLCDLNIVTLRCISVNQPDNYRIIRTPDE